MADADVDRVMAVWGCGEEVVGASHDGETAHLGGATGGVGVSEGNEYQAARGEVLRPASKAGKTGKAASTFWNVNDVVRVACARRGKVLCTFDLDEAALALAKDGELPDGLPSALRPLLQMAASADADVVATGATMVETFTGIRFEPDAVTHAKTFRVTPAQGELETD